MLPARMRKGALTGMWKVRYWDSWSRCRSDRTWKEVFEGENRPDMRRMFIVKVCIILERRWSGICLAAYGRSSAIGP